MQQLGSVSVLTLFLSGFFFTAYNAVIPGCLAETFFGKGDHTLLVLMLRAGCLLPLFLASGIFFLYILRDTGRQKMALLCTLGAFAGFVLTVSVCLKSMNGNVMALVVGTLVFSVVLALSTALPVHGHPHRMGADGADAPDFRRLNGRCAVRPDKSNDFLVRRIFGFADFPDCGLFTVCVFTVVFTLYPEERPCVFPLG